MNSFKTILSLYDYSGVWSKPYRDAGYNVIQIDIQQGNDARLVKRLNAEIYGIIAAPPCTVFSKAGAWVNRHNDEYFEGLSCVDAVYRYAGIYNPVFWALENPPGKLAEYLGPPSYKFHPYYFGASHSKLTYLWGKFKNPVPQLAEFNFIHTGDITSKLSSTAKNQRSQTPEGFANAFFLANQ